MCGIAGFYDEQIGQEAHRLLDRMLESIRHRGPDARGIWSDGALHLGHNRLSIIDLNECSNQPLHYQNLTITYNGEIYNYLEIKADLRKKGYSFSTDSDTEVILAAYKEWGEACVQRFVGMWAFAIWDKEKKELFCSRDRFGIKPFYYIHSSNKFYFGSEYKPLKLAPPFNNDLNLNQVSRGLQLGWVTYHNETYFESIRQVPAAHNLIFKNGSVTINKYWDIDLNKKFEGSFEEKVEKFRQLFTESIKLHMRSDVEVGGCLSGGLDSSAIASAVAKKFPDAAFKTFTIYYSGKDEVDERPWAEEVIKKYPSLRPFYFSPTDKNIEENFSKAIHHADVPITGSSPVSQYFVMQLAAQHNIKVVLDGQGSDEYLAGYMHSFYRLIGGLLKQLKLKQALKILNEHSRQQSFTAGKTANIFLKSGLAGLQSEQNLYALEYKNYFPFLSQNKSATPFFLDNKDGTRLNEFLYHLLFTTSLPSLLHYEDRNSMAFSIESRVPFLDHRLVEFAFSLSDHEKIYNGETKYILRKSLNDFLPKAIAERKDKKGFVTPGEVKWLRGALEFLMKDKIQLSFLNEKAVTEIIHEFKKGSNKNANLVWRLVVLNYWIKSAA